MAVAPPCVAGGGFAGSVFCSGTGGTWLGDRERCVEVRPGVVPPVASVTRPYLACAIAGDILEGRVLLRWTPAAPMDVGVAGLALFELREFFEDTETFRRRLPNFRKLSAPPLALETERRTVEWEVGRSIPPSTSFTVASSAAVPFMPNRKWSWFSIKNINTSWLSLYSSGDISCWGWESSPG